MSLVNQVLRDLQHRRGEHPDTTGLVAADTADAPRSRGLWVLVGAGAIAVGLAAFAAQRLLTGDEAPPPVPTVTATVEAAAEPMVAATPPHSDADVTAATESSRADAELSVAAEPDPAEGEASPLRRDDETAEDAEAAPARRDAEVAALPEPEVVSEPPPALTRTLVTTTPRQRADAAFGAGVRALSEGRRENAESAFRDALGHDASHADARLALANVLAAGGELREAEVQLLQGLRIAPDAAPLAERYARLLFERGDLAGAIGVLVASAPPVASNPDYHALLAALQQRAGNHAAAAATYAALVEVRPTQGLWWMGLGISLEEEQRDEAAYAAYENAMRDARLSPEVVAFVRERLAVLAR